MSSKVNVHFDDFEPAFFIGCGELDCFIELFGPENNSKNWRRFIESMRKGEQDDILFEEANGCTQILAFDDMVKFSVSKVGRRGGTVAVHVPADACYKAFELCAGVLEKQGI